MTTPIAVTSSDLRVTIDLENGGRLSSVKWRDLELAVEKRPNNLTWGWYAMAPWAGRIGRGELDTPRGIVNLPVDVLPPHAIHGLLLDSKIQVGDVSANEAMVWSNLPAPYKGAKVEQRVVVEESSLTWSLIYRNGDQSMPVWLGFHPWFKRVLGQGSEVEISNPASFMMILGEDGIPNGRIQGVTPPPWDDVFGGLKSAPTLTWPGVLKVTCLATEPWWVIYTKDPAGVCIEPQTAPPHAAELGLAPILGPDAELRFDYQFRFEAV